MKGPKVARDLAPALHNPRTISDPRLAALARSMAKFGDLSGIVYNVRTKRLVCGHQRLKHLQTTALISTEPARDERGTVAVGYVSSETNAWAYREVDWDDATEKAACVAANAAGGEFDDGKLRDIVLDLDRVGFDMGLLNLKSIDEILASAAPAGHEPSDEAPTPPQRATSRLGDLYLLGAHRLLCGDSTKAADVDRLMGSDRADMVFTDPPYALFGNSTGIGGVADDKMIRPFFCEVLGQAIRAVKCFGHIYVCCDWHSAFTLESIARELNLSAKNLCIWDKGSGGVGAMYQQCYEMVWFFANTPPQTTTTKKKGGGERIVQGVPNIWRFPRIPSRDRQHNAAKPIALIKVPLEASSDAGQIVLDLFGGSGSTLIAAEAAGRAARVMEIEPRYVDVIVKRWEDVTGRKATKEAR